MKAAEAYALMHLRFLEEWVHRPRRSLPTWEEMGRRERRANRPMVQRFVLATDAPTESGVGRQLAAIARDTAFDVVAEETAIEPHEVLAIQTSPRCIQVVVQHQVAGFATFHTQLRRQVYPEQHCPACRAAVALVDSTHPEEPGLLLAECDDADCTWSATPPSITVYRRGASA